MELDKHAIQRADERRRSRSGAASDLKLGINADSKCLTRIIVRPAAQLCL